MAIRPGQLSLPTFVTSLLAPAAGVTTLPAGRSAVVVRSLLLVSGAKILLGTGARLRIL